MEPLGIGRAAERPAAWVAPDELLLHRARGELQHEAQQDADDGAPHETPGAFVRDHKAAEEVNRRPGHRRQHEEHHAFQLSEGFLVSGAKKSRRRAVNSTIQRVTGLDSYQVRVVQGTAVLQNTRKRLPPAHLDDTPNNSENTPGTISE